MHFDIYTHADTRKEYSNIGINLCVHVYSEFEILIQLQLPPSSLSHMYERCGIAEILQYYIALFNAQRGRERERELFGI